MPILKKLRKVLSRDDGMDRFALPVDEVWIDGQTRARMAVLRTSFSSKREWWVRE